MRNIGTKLFGLKRFISYSTLLATLSIFTLAFGANLLMAKPVAALCAAAPESGVWQNTKGNDPFQIRITQPNCEVDNSGVPQFNVTVWVKQSSGALYKRGTFAGDKARAKNGVVWVLTKYSTGGYLKHQWMKKYTYDGVDYLRVWIYYESLDSKPSASEEFWFRKVR
jgi:hypothetical protein